MTVKLLTEQYLEFLSLKGGCRGSSESSHVKLLEISCTGLFHISWNNYQYKRVKLSVSAQNSFCHSNPCVHGSCTETLTGYTCTCVSGYMGKNCDVGK